MRRFLAFVLLGAGSACRPPERLDRLYETAEADVRAGELRRAESEAEHGLDLAAKRRNLAFQWRFRLLRADILLFSGRSEVVLAQLKEPVPESAEFAPLAARRLLLRARATSLLRRPGEAKGMLEEAHGLAEAAHAADVLADVETVQGAILMNQQHYPEAEQVLRSAIDRAHAIGSSYQEAGAMVNLGSIRTRTGRFDEAASYLERASSLAGPKAGTLYTVAQQNLAACYNTLGEHDRAIRILLDAVQRLEHSGAKFYLDLPLGEIGRSYLLQGELRQATPYLERALTAANDVSNNRSAANLAGNLALVYAELGEWDKAEASNQESIRLRKTGPFPGLYHNEFNAALIAAGRGQLAEAARLYEQEMEDGKDDPWAVWSAHVGLGRLAAADRRPQEAVRHFEAALSLVEKTRSQLNRTEFKLPFLALLISAYRQYVDTLVDQGEIERALAVADSSHAQVMAERSEPAPARRLATGAFRDLARRTNSVLLSYWLAPKRSYAWVVTEQGTHQVELPPRSAIEPLVASYREAIERQLADPLRTRLAAGEKLFATLIEPVRQWIPPGAHVIVVPDGALHGLNLESLPVSGDAPHFWIEDVTVSIAPSLALLAEKPRRAAASKRLLLVGNPTGADPSFPPLTHAAEEIAAVTRHLPADVIDGERATPASYTAAGPDHFSAIHFTAHAIANGESPLDSAVLLAGGKLYARDVMATQLAADLVTISACRGAGARLYSGEGLVGFTWAFLHAGARNVIAGLWDVNDQSTSRLMDVLYRELATGRSPADALRSAKLSLIESRGNLRKPYYWAPFQLYTVAP